MIEFKFELSTNHEAFIKKTSSRIGVMNPMLVKAGVYMLGSIDKNFRVSGRPSKWKGLAPLTKAMRRKGSKSGGFKILQDTGRLRGSISTKVFSQTTKAAATVGTNVEYAPLMHFGGMTKGTTFNIKQHKRRITQAFGKPIEPKTITVRPYKMKIGPKEVQARPFVLFQNSDIVAIENLGMKHIEGATK